MREKGVGVGQDELARRNKPKNDNRPSVVSMKKSNRTTRSVGVGKISGLVTYPSK